MEVYDYLIMILVQFGVGFLIYVTLNWRLTHQISQRLRREVQQEIRKDILDFYREAEKYLIVIENKIKEFQNTVRASRSLSERGAHQTENNSEKKATVVVRTGAKKKKATSKAPGRTSAASKKTATRKKLQTKKNLSSPKKKPAPAEDTPIPGAPEFETVSRLDKLAGSIQDDYAFQITGEAPVNQRELENQIRENLYQPGEKPNSGAGPAPPRPATPKPERATKSRNPAPVPTTNQVGQPDSVSPPVAGDQTPTQAGGGMVRRFLAGLGRPLQTWARSQSVLAGEVPSPNPEEKNSRLNPAAGKLPNQSPEKPVATRASPEQSPLPADFDRQLRQLLETSPSKLARLAEEARKLDLSGEGSGASPTTKGAEQSGPGGFRPNQANQGNMPAADPAPGENMDSPSPAIGDTNPTAPAKAEAENQASRTRKARGILRRKVSEREKIYLIDELGFASHEIAALMNISQTEVDISLKLRKRGQGGAQAS